MMFSRTAVGSDSSVSSEMSESKDEVSGGITGRGTKNWNSNG